MKVTKPLFDVEKAKQTIAKGRRANWIRRRGTMSRGFSYTDAAGKKITSKETLERIASLVIPPAWKYVRISPHAGSSLQAVGMDTTGRVQYIYHPKHAEKRQRKKYAKIERFGEYLPALRRATTKDLELEGFPRERVLAIMTRLINSLYMRIGTEKSARHYKTYGITTLKNKHLRFGRNNELIFDFVGKSHIKHRKVLVDDDLAAIMKELKSLGGAKKLFHYLDDEGNPRSVTPGEVNSYLKSHTAPEFSAKDLRTWGATLLAAIQLAEIGPPQDANEAKKNIVKAVKRVAEQLGNTPTVCRGSYIHPTVLKCYESGITLDEFRPKKSRRIKRRQDDYEPEERALLRLFGAHSGK